MKPNGTKPMNHLDTPKEIKQVAGWSAGLGVLLIGLGLLAIVLPFFATLTVTFLLAWIFAIGGVAKLIDAYQHRRSGRTGVKVLTGVLSLLLGILLFANPLQGILSITLVLGIVVFIEGAIEVVLAFQMRPDANWAWVLVSGILSVILGVLIWSQWPSNAPWILGVLVGVSLLTTGLWTLMISLAARSRASQLERN